VKGTTQQSTPKLQVKQQHLVKHPMSYRKLKSEKLSKLSRIAVRLIEVNTGTRLKLKFDQIMNWALLIPREPVIDLMRSSTKVELTCKSLEATNWFFFT